LAILTSTDLLVIPHLVNLAGADWFSLQIIKNSDEDSCHHCTCAGYFAFDGWLVFCANCHLLVFAAMVVLAGVRIGFF